MTSVNSKYVSLAANRTFFSTLDTRVNHVLRVDSFNRVKQFFFVFFFSFVHGFITRGLRSKFFNSSSAITRMKVTGRRERRVDAFRGFKTDTRGGVGFRGGARGVREVYTRAKVLP